MLAIAQKYSTYYEPNGEILRYLRCMQYHLAKARFPGEEDEGEDEEVEEEAGGGDGGGDIPHNESHPGLEAEENDPAVAAVQPEDLMPPGANAAATDVLAAVGTSASLAMGANLAMF